MNIGQLHKYFNLRRATVKVLLWKKPYGLLYPQLTHVKIIWKQMLKITYCSAETSEVTYKKKKYDCRRMRIENLFAKQKRPENWESQSTMPQLAIQSKPDAFNIFF